MNFSKKNSVAFSLLFLALVGATAWTKFYTTNSDDMDLRDRTASEYALDQQRFMESDREITQQIRQELMNDKYLSTYARNITIITVNGMVTLKGAVLSMNERMGIVKHADAIAGSANVNDQIVIMSKRKNSGSKGEFYDGDI